MAKQECLGCLSDLMSSCRNEPSLASTLPRSWRRQYNCNTIVQLTAWRKPSRSPDPESQGTGRRASHSQPMWQEGWRGAAGTTRL